MLTLNNQAKEDASTNLQQPHQHQSNNPLLLDIADDLPLASLPLPQDPLSLSPTLQPGSLEALNPLNAKRQQEDQVQLITNKIIPNNIQVQVGSVVHSRSVKIIHSRCKQTDRDDWWDELRYEIKQHALTQGCTHVFGYEEKSSTYEDLILLSAYGTAAKIIKTDVGGFLQHKIIAAAPFYSSTPQLGRAYSEDPHIHSNTSESTGSLPQNREMRHFLRPGPLPSLARNASTNTEIQSVSPLEPPLAHLSGPMPRITRPCQFCHCVQIPKKEYLYQKRKIVKCKECTLSYVPEVLMTTLDPPAGIKIIGKPRLIEAKVCREKSYSKGEGHAMAVSEKMLFMEIDLHEQLIQKMKMLSMNSLFSINFNLAVGENIIIGMASATAARLYALPLPRTLQIERNARLMDNAELFDQKHDENIQKMSELNAIQALRDKVYQVTVPHDELAAFVENSHHSGPLLVDDGFNRAESLPAQIFLAGGGAIKEQFAIKEIKEVDQDPEEPLVESEGEQEIKINEINPTFRGMASKGFVSPEPPSTKQNSPQPFSPPPLMKSHSSNPVLGGSPLNSFTDRHVSKTQSLNRISSLSPTKELKRRGSNLATGSENIRSKILLQVDRKASIEIENVSNGAEGEPGLPQQQPQPSHINEIIENYNNIETLALAIRNIDEKKDAPYSPQILGSQPSSVLDADQNQFQHVIDIDDQKDQDLLFANIEFQLPPGISICNCEFMPTYQGWQQFEEGAKEQDEVPEHEPILFTKVASFDWSSYDSNKINQKINEDVFEIFRALFAFISARNLEPCAVSGVTFHLSFKQDHNLNIILNAVILREAETPSTSRSISMIQEAEESPAETNRKIQRLKAEKQKHAFLNLHPSLESPSPQLQGSTKVLTKHSKSEDCKYVESVQVVSLDSRQLSKRKLKKGGCFGSLFRCSSSSKGAGGRNSRLKSKTSLIVRELVEKKVKLVPLSFRPFRHVRQYIGFIDVIHVRELELEGKPDNLDLLQEKFIEEACEIMKARARGLGANCVLGFKLADFYVNHECGTSDALLCIICLTGNAVVYPEEEQDD